MSVSVMNHIFDDRQDQSVSYTISPTISKFFCCSYNIIRSQAYTGRIHVNFEYFGRVVLSCR